MKFRINGNPEDIKQITIQATLNQGIYMYEVVGNMGHKKEVIIETDTLELADLKDRISLVKSNMPKDIQIKQQFQFNIN
tara:strand:- start:2167 stop:2403 length:237 start_codon:yes stop_codon:yes gene_type:complete